MLVWNATSSITVIASATRREASCIFCIEATVSAIAPWPCSACRNRPSVRLSSWRAASALLDTARLSWPIASIDVRRLPAWASVRVDRRRLPSATCEPARLTSAALLRISATRPDNCPQVASTVRPIWASSSRPRTWVRWDRSPLAMASVPRRSARTEALKLK